MVVASFCYKLNDCGDLLCCSNYGERITDRTEQIVAFASRVIARHIPNCVCTRYRSLRPLAVTCFYFMYVLKAEASTEDT